MKTMVKYVDANLRYFKDRKSMLIFYLAKLDGEQRAKMLGITERHYINDYIAREWYKNIMFELGSGETPDNIEDYYKALAKLKELYENMTERN